MDIESFHSPVSFLGAARAFLVANEAANNLILGVTFAAVRGDYDVFAGWVARDGAEVVAAAAQTPPHDLLLARSDSNRGVDAMAAATHHVPGVIGATPEVDRFVRNFPDATRKFRQGVYQLSQLKVKVDPGSRRASDVERALLLGWMIDFMHEVTGEADSDRARLNLERRLDRPADVGGVWVHESNGEIVCMSGYAGPTPNGMRIGPVYTPPEHRGNGYASRLVAAQSRWLLDHGRRFCFLYTDLDNPTSNSIYKRIGYEMVCESAEYSFSR